jgi:hypothetical protein
MRYDDDASYCDRHYGDRCDGDDNSDDYDDRVMMMMMVVVAMKRKKVLP